LELIVSVMIYSFVCWLLLFLPTVLAIVAGITGINIHGSNWLEFMLQLRKFNLSMNLSAEFFCFNSTLYEDFIYK
jgi:hypothetical protein